MAGYENCKGCGKELSDRERAKGWCHDCWCSRIQEMRAFYQPYEKRLLAVLEEKGIHADPGTINGLDEMGRPLEAVRKTDTPMIHLRDNEYAVWLFRARDGLFAFPDNGIALRYVIPSADGEFMKKLDDLGLEEGSSWYKNHCFLAAVSNGRHVYALSDDGKIYHTNPWRPRPITMSSRLELHREVWRTFFSEEQIRESAAWLNGGRCGIVNVDGNTMYFDPGQKSFFRVCADGNLYHGYDVSYLRLSKEDAIDTLLRRTRLFETWEKCRRGEIPMAAKLDLTEEAPKNKEYVPEENFGYGLHFM